jgi:hypothetical protein
MAPDPQGNFPINYGASWSQPIQPNTNLYPGSGYPTNYGASWSSGGGMGWNTTPYGTGVTVGGGGGGYGVQGPGGQGVPQMPLEAAMLYQSAQNDAARIAQLDRSLDINAQLTREANAQRNQIAMQELAVQRERLQVEREATAARLEIDRARLGLEGRQLDISQQLAGYEGQRVGFEGERLGMEKERDKFERGRVVSEILANPRSIVQSLLLLGQTPDQAAAWLNSQDMVRQLINGGSGGSTGAGASVPSVAQAGLDVANLMQNTPSWEQILQSGANVNSQGRNAAFPFIEGRKLPVQQTLGDIESNSQRIPLISSLASFSGQTPESFFGEFQQFLPKGGPVALPSVR